MRNIILLLLSMVLAVSFGCTSMRHELAADEDPNGEWVPLKETAARGQENINKIELGMTKQQILKIMGTKKHYHARSFRGTTIIPHPFKREVFEYKNKTHEVLYYYTVYARGDAALTPIVLVGNKVAGWGWTYLNKLK